MNFIGDFERVLVNEARHRGFDGVISGHIHKPEVKTLEGMQYGNSGDWVESLCRPLVEHGDGTLSIVYWTEILPQTTEPEHRWESMHILIVTDAWQPQVNGVVRTLTETIRELREFGHTVEMITPLLFTTLPCPTYPDIRLSLFPYKKVSN